jgi:hypothetical protein
MMATEFLFNIKHNFTSFLNHLRGWRDHFVQGNKDSFTRVIGMFLENTPTAFPSVTEVRGKADIPLADINSQAGSASWAHDQCPPTEPQTQKVPVPGLIFCHLCLEIQNHF